MCSIEVPRRLQVLLSLASGHPASSQKNCACASRMLAHLATFAGTPCHFASDDGARLYDLSRLRRLPHEFDLIVYNFRVNGADAQFRMNVCADVNARRPRPR